jgi:hypothetical protein
LLDARRDASQFDQNGDLWEARSAAARSVPSVDGPRRPRTSSGDDVRTSTEQARVEAVKKEYDMSKGEAFEQNSGNLRDVAKATEQTGIANEGAAYTQAIHKEEGEASKTDARPS